MEKLVSPALVDEDNKIHEHDRTDRCEDEQVPCQEFVCFHCITDSEPMFAPDTRLPDATPATSTPLYDIRNTFVARSFIKVILVELKGIGPSTS
jgi:hypothetical protein